MDSLLNLGVIGFSPGNGHPVSFSSIINGFDEAIIRDLDFPSIARYLCDADPSYIGSISMRVNHIWCDELRLARKIASAAFIKNVHESYKTFPLHKIDGVLILMDECPQRSQIIEYMVSHGIKVFVDKPLFSRLDESEKYKELLSEGAVMSCSCLRYDPQFDDIRYNHTRGGAPDHVTAIITGDLNKYLAHALEPVVSVLGAVPLNQIENVNIHRLEGLRLLTPNTAIDILCVKSKIPLFKYDFFWDENYKSVQIKDNFLAFYHGIKAIEAFFRGSEPIIDVDETRMICDTNSRLSEGL